MSEYDRDSIINVHKYFAHANLSFKFLRNFEHGGFQEIITCFGIYWEITGQPYNKIKLIPNVSTDEITFFLLQGLGLDEFFFLQQFKNLVIIDCHPGNFIDSVVPLKNLFKLRELHLRGNKINNLKPLADLINLEILDLCDNRLVYIGELSNLKKLRKLYLSDDSIYDISPISSLVNLEVLDISRSEVSEITSLSSLKNLKFLNLQSNNIKKTESVKLAKILKKCKVHIDFTDGEFQESGYIFIKLIDNNEVSFLIDSSEERRNNVDHVYIRLLDNLVKIKGNMIEEMKIIIRDIITTKERNMEFIQTYKREHFFEETADYIRAQFDY